MTINTNIGNKDLAIEWYISRRIKLQHSANPTKQEGTITGFHCRLVRKLISYQAIIRIIDCHHISLGIKANKTMIGTKPKLMFIIFQYLIGHIIWQRCRFRISSETLTLQIIMTQSTTVGSKP